MSDTEALKHHGNECGPGYSSPEDAIKGPREKILYIPCIVPDKSRPDYVVVVDVDPKSSKFLEVINRCPVTHKGDELHHSGWNACSSCHGQKCVKRDKLIFPCLGSDRIYIFDTSKVTELTLHKTIEPQELYDLKLSSPHTSHCLPNGEVMISTMGNGPDGDAKCDFLLLDSKDFSIKGTWRGSVPADDPLMGYDFWYQVKFDTMISTEWGAPKAFKQGFNPDDVTAGLYGKHLHVWSWSKKTLTETITLEDGNLPLETRFLHNPYKSEGYVGCALSTAVFRYRLENKKWVVKKVIAVPPKTVDNWLLPVMPGVMTDIIISMDDHFLYFSNWVHGDIRQYDIRCDPPKMTGQVFIGGSITTDSGVTVTKDDELTSQPKPLYVKGRKIWGGPQMLQLSLDGKRLYVTTSLFKPWDEQFYPKLLTEGSVLLKLKVDIENGGIEVDQDFLVDFGKEPDGPVLAHEIRYPGGDCTSDIFLPHDCAQDCPDTTS